MTSDGSACFNVTKRLPLQYTFFTSRRIGECRSIVFDAEASLKNQKVAILVVLRGAFLGGIGTLVLNEFWYFFKMKVSFLLY